MTAGYLGLIIGYILIAILVLWLFIRLEGWLVIKMVIVALAVWYAVAMFLLIPNMLGWAIDVQKPPDKSRLASYLVDEPKAGSKGAIYLWVLTKVDCVEPRAYVIPYSRKMHKRLIKLQRQARGSGGYIQIIKTKRQPGKSEQIGGDKSKAKLQFRIINPIDMFPKEQ
jgi:hypothetical protein